MVQFLVHLSAMAASRYQVAHPLLSNVQLIRACLENQNCYNAMDRRRCCLRRAANHHRLPQMDDSPTNQLSPLTNSHRARLPSLSSFHHTRNTSCCRHRSVLTATVAWHTGACRMLVLLATESRLLFLHARRQCKHSTCGPRVSPGFHHFVHPTTTTRPLDRLARMPVTSAQFLLHNHALLGHHV